MLDTSPNHSDALIARMEQALQALDEHRLGWFQAVRQDAVETFPRLGWWRQCRVGCRVPVMDMVINPLRRNVRRVAEEFVSDAAIILAQDSGRSAPNLELIGRGIELDWIADPTEVDFTFHRGWLQGNVPARRAFEADLLIHLEGIYRSLVRSQLKRLMDEIVEAMQSSPQQEMDSTATHLSASKGP